MHLAIILLRLIHVLSGIFWVGTVLFNTFYLFPVLAAAGPAAAPVMAGLQRRRLMTALPIAALLTIASGAALFWLVSGGSVAAFSHSRTGATLAGSALLAIAGFLIGMFVTRPAALEAGRLGRELASLSAGPNREALQRRMAALQRRSATGSSIMTVLLLGAAAGMAVARYL